MKKPGLEKTILSRDGTLKQPITIDYTVLRKTVLTLRALEHDMRLTIIEMLSKKDLLTVSEIFAKLNVEQSVASQHLAVLRRAGIVKTKRDGKFVNYAINKERIDEINKLIKELN
jgi:DNA-binding transcriptional ArsR family regulator